MLVDTDFLVPDYYPAFHCKIKGCRHTCCESWPISISMQDYFQLLSVPCSQELRRRLDCSLHILENPTPERYAQICPKFDGDCGMHLADGRCGLQAELGETALSLVCRLYPRGIRIGENCECSCANSCEAVVELFLHRDSPIQFIRRKLSFHLPDQPPRQNLFHTMGLTREIRLRLVQILQQRELPLYQRLILLDSQLYQINQMMILNQRDQLVKILNSPIKNEKTQSLSASPSHERLLAGLVLAEKMGESVDQKSQRIRPFGEGALAWFNTGNPLEQYQKSCTCLNSLLPHWEIIFEHLLVNHIFFEQFPFQDRPVDICDESLGLCAIYALLRFLTLGWLPSHASEEEFTDMIATAFRFIDHTPFDRYGASLLSPMSKEERHELLKL